MRLQQSDAGRIGASSIAMAVGLAVCADVRAQPELAAGQVDEVVVTANRRETALSDVPFSIMAYGSEQIEEKKIDRAEDLFQRVPGATFVPNVKTASFVGIRGLLTLEDAPAADLPVAFFMDDVYISGISELNLNYFDLERIEVLRGPQGTLFGRNVIGGAIALTSRRPTFDEAFGARVSLGDHGRVEADGYLNGPLVEGVLAGRLTFSSRQSNGPIFNRHRQERLDDDNTGSVRAQLLFTPSEDVDVLVSADYTTDKGRGSALKIVGFNPALIPDTSADPFTVDQDYDTRFERELFGGLVRADWRTAAGVLTSITAYRRNTSYTGRDVDASILPIVHTNEAVNNWQFTQEVRLASDAGRSLSYVVGAYYLRGNNYREERHQWNGLPGTLLFSAIGPGLKRNNQAQDVELTSYAAFGELTWRLNDQISAALGGRYTVDEKSGVTMVTGPLNPAVKAVPQDLIVPFSADWSAFTPRAVLRYEPNSDLNFYATVAKGFKGGGFTAGLPTLAGLSTPFAPEKATNYEIGTKSRLFDRRLSVNATLFRQDTKDLQVRAFNSFGQSIVGNAASARVQGLELETSARVNDRLELTADYTHLDAKYRNFRLGSTDFSGNRLPYAPKHSITLGGRYSHPLADDATLTLAADYVYKSRSEMIDANTLAADVKRQTRSNILNASVEYATADGRWTISAWGKNLTDDAVLLAAVDVTSFWATPAEFGAGERGYVGWYNRPRSFGVTLTFKH